MKYFIKWKKMRNKIKIFIFLISIILSINIINASEQIWCGNKNWKDRYNCQIKNYCENYKPKTFHFKTKDFFETQKHNLDEAKKIYIENQNSIYSCALIDIQKRTYKTIKEKLAKIDSTGELKSIIDKKIELKLNKIKLLEKQLKCISPENQEENKETFNIKQEVLSESAYEFCKYNY